MNVWLRGVLGVLALVGIACAGPAAWAQTAQNPAKAGPTDATGHTAPAGTPLAPLPPPDATTAGSPSGGVSVPSRNATGGHPGDTLPGTPGSAVPAPDASTRQTQPASR